MSGQDDANDVQRRYQKPYGGSHTIPTISKYREEKQERQANAIDSADVDENDESYKQRAKDYWH
ncbi:hypothetical protein LTR53_018935, partial [Teratosphaeriaceae sp. CCFEE 6253]